MSLPLGARVRCITTRYGALLHGVEGVICGDRKTRTAHYDYAVEYECPIFIDGRAVTRLGAWHGDLEEVR